MTDRLNLLLLDDQPFAKKASTGVAQLRREGASSNWREALDRCFKLWWLQHPDEMRQYYYLVRAIKGRRIQTLGELGLLPELVVFDFALTSVAGYPATLENRKDTNPLPQLVDAATRLGCPEVMIRREPLPDPRENGYPVGTDRFGCYAGSLINLELCDLPCVGIPTTQYHQKAETFFFEWFLDRPLHGLFDSKSRTGATWDSLLHDGLPFLRAMLVDRMRAGTVRVSLHDLLHLIHDPPSPVTIQEQAIQITSIYGRRSLSLEALFFDRVHPDPTDEEARPEDRREEILAFSQSCLEAVFEGIQSGAQRLVQSELEAAINLAERFQSTYLSEIFEERLRLSTALYEPRTFTPETLTREELELAGRWGVDVSTRDFKAKVGKGPWLGTIISEAGEQPIVARTATLFCIVYAESLARREGFTSYYSALREVAAALRPQRLEDEIEQAESLRERLLLTLSTYGGKQALEFISGFTAEVQDLLKLAEVERRLNDAEVDPATGSPLSEAAVLRDVQRQYGVLTARTPATTNALAAFINRYRQAFEAVCLAGVKSVATTEMVYDLLAPSPRRVALWRHQKETLEGGKPDYLNDIGAPLKRLHHGSEAAVGGWGDLGLSVAAVLDGRTAPEDHGLLPGEGHLLRLYAEALRFPSSVWPEWLRSAL